MKRRQRGIALISVLLVMSLALLIVSGLLRSNRLLLQGSAQQLHQVSMRQLAVAGECWALLVLEQATQAGHKTVDFTQAWATEQPGLDHDDVRVHVAIEDLAGRLNLNALLVPGKVDPLTLARWTRLLALLGLPELQLPQVGALRELSQLRLLPGVDAKVLRQLEPWVALLPAQAALNVNTAPVMVLRTLADVDAATANALANQRATAPWNSVQAFTKDPLLAGKGLASHGLGVGSRWYRIAVHITQGRTTLRAATDVEFDAKTRRLRVLQRHLLPLIVSETAP